MNMSGEKLTGAESDLVDLIRQRNIVWEGLNIDSISIVYRPLKDLYNKICGMINREASGLFPQPDRRDSEKGEE
jgi:hypothetical protein